jgi:predicted dehydrogenase
LEDFILKKINVGIIGIGRIASKYINPIKEDEKFNLMALCDVKESVKQISQESNTLFYTDYMEMLANKDIDLIVITTPPNTHFEIAKHCLQGKKNVILEKPAVLNTDELNTLIDLSKENNVVFDVIFHWRYGNEVLYFLEKVKDFGEIKRMESTVYDPYTDPSLHIKDEYIGLSGSWFDSGINCLSLLSLFVDVSKLELVEKEYVTDQKSNLDIFSKHVYKMEDKHFSITVDWRYNNNHKFTQIFFHKDVLYMDHSSQSIYLNNKLLVNLDQGDRLENHYRNYFKTYDEGSNFHKAIYDIHNILLRDK